MRGGRPVTSAFGRKPIGMSDMISDLSERQKVNLLSSVSQIDDTAPHLGSDTSTNNARNRQGFAQSSHSKVGGGVSFL